MKSEQIKEITDRAAEQLVGALQAGHSEALTAYLNAIGRFRRYSLHNVLLIASQKPSASYVAGFRTWNELGRFVKKGEKGIMILAPIVRRMSVDVAELEETSRSILGFRAAYVFDISQTDGKELPQIGVVEGDPRDCCDKLRRFASAQGISVEYSTGIAPARGISCGGRITLLPGLSENTVKGHRAYLAHLKSFFGMRKISAITIEMVEDYRDHRRQQPAKRNPQRTIKGATVNRELECLKCIFDLAVKRKYIPENPAAAVKHFNELRERPVRRMLTVDEEIRIVEAAPPYLRVAIVLLSQTGGRTYSEGLSLRWDQVDFDQQLIRLGNNVKTEGSVAPIPLSEFACAVLQAWQKALGSGSPYIFPSPKNPDRPISTVKTAWKGTLRRAGMPHFSIYTLRTFSVRG